jgi:hypothetical protein
MASNNPRSFPLLLVHNGALTSSPERPLRPIPVPAVNGARAPPLYPLSRVYASPLRVEPAHTRNGALWAELGNAGDSPAKRRHATPTPPRSPPRTARTRPELLDLARTDQI